MADDDASTASDSALNNLDSTSIEINIKTLEPQVHKLHVHKNERVLNLNDKIVGVAGNPMDRQGCRCCRGHTANAMDETSRTGHQLFSPSRMCS